MRATADAGRPGTVEAAPAKINLWLHVVGRRGDGRHVLDSYVVFAELGDDLRAEAAAELSLSVEGPFAATLWEVEDNLAMRAARSLARLAPKAGGARLTLRKRLPVASGIGGGSADAAAALRALQRLWGVAPGPGALARLALSLGADVPVCLAARPARMGGIGERLGPAPAPPAAALALVNPGVEVATGAVFARLARADNPAPADPPARFQDAAALAQWLRATRNDLEAAAETLAPPIAKARAALMGEGALFARMSGSGATVFGLFASDAEAERATRAIARAEPGWWVAPSRINRPG